MTLEGTNSYLLHAGHGLAVLIDPGPDIPEHVTAILTAAAEHQIQIAAIALTHDHLDHAGAAEALVRHTGAPIYAHTTPCSPNGRRLDHGQHLEVGDLSLVAMETPGHARDHLAFWFPEEATLFTGDLIVGRGTVVISPPDGDMRAYTTTLQRVRDELHDLRRLYGGHGEPVETPRAKIDEYLAHRAGREAQLLYLLADGPQTIARLVARMYPHLTLELAPLAERQVVAHLTALEREGRVRARRGERLATDGMSSEMLEYTLISM